MRAHDFTTMNSLFEIDMSPTNLGNLAKKIDARVGMEFEMAMPGMINTNSAYASEPEEDWDYDRRAREIDDVVDFFNDSDYNSRSDIKTFEEKLRSDYEDFVANHIDKEWESVKEDVVRQYLEDEERLEPGTEEFDSEFEDVMSPFNSRTRNIIYNQWREEYDDFPSEEDFFKDQGIRHMSEVVDHYQIVWPHWTVSDDENDEFDENVGKEVANMLQRYVKMPVKNFVGRRHLTQDYDTEWGIHTDASIDLDDNTSIKLEIASPVMPIEDMIREYNQVLRFADDHHCYTNSSTGLHINLSLANVDMSKIDYFKLVLLLGDEYVLKLYDRMNNTQYAASSIKKLKSFLSSNPDTAERYIQYVKNNLFDLASRDAVENPTSKLGKHISVNWRTPRDNDSWIEFRSPGGDWLKKDPKTIFDTVYRFAVALDASLDPNKYRNEYAKKMYKFLSSALMGEEEVSRIIVNYLTKDVAAATQDQASVETARKLQLVRQRYLDLEASRANRIDPESGIFNWLILSPFSLEPINARGRTLYDAIENARRDNPALSKYNPNDFNGRVVSVVRTNRPMFNWIVVKLTHMPNSDEFEVADSTEVIAGSRQEAIELAISMRPSWRTDQLTAKSLIQARPLSKISYR